MSFPSTLPDELWSLVFGYLHKPYDCEKAQVIAELNGRASMIPEDDDRVHHVASLMMPTECQWGQIQKKYRLYYDQWAIAKCRCGMCRNSLYGNV